MSLYLQSAQQALLRLTSLLTASIEHCTHTTAHTSRMQHTLCQLTHLCEQDQLSPEGLTAKAVAQMGVQQQQSDSAVPNSSSSQHRDAGGSSSEGQRGGRSTRRQQRQSVQHPHTHSTQQQQQQQQGQQGPSISHEHAACVASTWGHHLVCVHLCCRDPTANEATEHSFWLVFKDHQCDICGCDLELQVGSMCVGLGLWEAANKCDAVWMLVLHTCCCQCKLAKLECK